MPGRFQACFCCRPSTHKRIKHHITFFCKFASIEIQQYNRFLLTSKYDTNNRQCLERLWCWKRSRWIKSSGLLSKYNIRRKGGAIRRLRAIVQSGSVAFWCSTNTLELHCIHGHVEMIHARLRWILDLVGSVQDVHRTLCSTTNSPFGLSFSSKAPYITNVGCFG